MTHQFINIIFIIIYMNNNNNNFIELLKEHTIDNNFIDKFLKKFKIGSELDFHIKDKNVSLGNIRKRLNNAYTKLIS